MKIFPLILNLILLVSCSSNDIVESDNNFEVTLIATTTTVAIDEPYSINVTAPENIKTIGVSLDNFVTTIGNSSLNFGNSTTLNFNFDTLGQKTISIKAINENNRVSIKQLNVTVIRGNAIKITGVKVVSFYNINTTWDPEYAASNTNRLADVFFSFIKNSLNTPYNITNSYKNWYKSTVKTNQGDLLWDLSDKNIYCKPSTVLRFGLTDEDDPPLGQDLLNGFPDYREINFNDYSVAKPSIITYTNPNINLQIQFTVDWVN